MLIEIKERRNLMGFGDTRRFNQDLVELLLLGESDDLLNEIGLEGATVLRPNHCLHVLD